LHRPSRLSHRCSVLPPGDDPTSVGLLAGQQRRHAEESPGIGRCLGGPIPSSCSVRVWVLRLVKAQVTTPIRSFKAEDLKRPDEAAWASRTCSFDCLDLMGIPGDYSILLHRSTPLRQRGRDAIFDNSGSILWSAGGPRHHSRSKEPTALLFHPPTPPHSPAISQARLCKKGVSHNMVRFEVGSKGALQRAKKAAQQRFGI